MQYAKRLAEKIMEAEEEGRWITTKSGARVFIENRDYSLKNDTPQTKPSTKLKLSIKKALKNIPKEHQKGLAKDIILVDFRENRREIFDNDTYAVYNSDTQTIRVNTGNERNQNGGVELEKTIAHEIGHHYMHTQMDENMRRKYFYIYKDNVLAVRKQGTVIYDKVVAEKYFPSQYAVTNYEEDFAENYGRFVVGQKIPEDRKAFLKKHVFK